ncbi:MAG TPA: hypothetical protein VGN57_06645 [Pirellulaceae bacterium]|jgi:hypothetical protein|nr:hypothetical protein [Pirellulaceae bacterium]
MTRFRLPTPLLAIAALSVSFAGPSLAQDSGPGASRLARLVWQDYESKTLHWGELVRNGEAFKLRTGGTVSAFPKLDAKRQELVQMDRVGPVALVGVRDDAGGAFESGWTCVDRGVERSSSGWRYGDAPRTIAKSLSDSQGNPAHLYVYDDVFYLANDALNGFTRIDPKLLATSPDDYRGTFHRGGGGHITFAAVDGRIAYGTWILGEGPRKGRVDVTDLSKPFDRSLAYSFFLPVGGLHGATTNSGKVFFAPSDGIYWIDADEDLRLTGDQVRPRHLSLGADPETKRPLRTGAFANHENWTLFTTGRGENSSLCLIKASASEPVVVKVSIPTAKGLSLVTPDTVLTEEGERYAFVFQDRLEGEAKETLTVVDLDPDGDRDFSDARVAKTVDVGASEVSGHYGHHAVAFDEQGRYAFIANPGDGQIWLMSLVDLTIVAKQDVGGVPTKVIAVGGNEAAGQ